MASRPERSMCSGWNLWAVQETATIQMRPNLSSSNQPFVSPKILNKKYFLRTQLRHVKLFYAEKLMISPTRLYAYLHSAQWWLTLHATHCWNILTSMLPLSHYLRINSWSPILLWAIHFIKKIELNIFFQSHLWMLNISRELWIFNCRQELQSARELLSFLGLFSKNRCLLRFSPPSPLLCQSFCLFQTFLLLPPQSPCCCALDRRWCWAGGPPPVMGVTLCVATTSTREKRAWKHGERST